MSARTSGMKQQAAATALLVQPFTLYVLLLSWLAPASADNWAKADPILSILWPQLCPLAALLLLAIWWKVARPDPPLLRRAARQALLAFVAGLGAICLMRWLRGPSLPSFVPPEENSGPGLWLSMCAGYWEELVVRLAFLPVVWELCARLPGRKVAVVIACGLVFAALHLGGSEPYSAAFFATRFLIPGCLFSAIALQIGLPVAVIFHCTTHILLPVLIH